MIKLTARKWNGDDRCSWAIFRSDRPGTPVVSGLSRPEVAYYKKQIASAIEEAKLCKLCHKQPATANGFCSICSGGEI